MVNDLKTLSINLNAQHVNGMTPFNLAVQMHGWLLETVDKRIITH